MQEGTVKAFLFEFTLMCAIVFILFFLLGGFLFAQFQPQLQYEIIEGDAYVSGVSGPKQHITIPENHDGYSVRGILSGAFEDDETVQTVEIEANTLRIGHRAFKHAGNLEQIDGNMDGLTRIGVHAFEGTPFLADRQASDENIIGSVLLFASTDDETYHVPSDVTHIAGGVLKGNDTVETLHIHSDVQTIESEAFSDIEPLHTVMFEGDEVPLTFLGQHAFSNNPNLETIHQPDRTNLETVEGYVFYNTPWRAQNSEEGYYYFADHQIELD